jgi:hypothetical protein
MDLISFTVDQVRYIVTPVTALRAVHTLRALRALRAITIDRDPLPFTPLYLCSVLQFNVSHTINTLSFGDNFPGVSSPLDGESKHIKDTHGMYQYYIKVVPTRYKALGGT